MPSPTLQQSSRKILDKLAELYGHDASAPGKTLTFAFAIETDAVSDPEALRVLALEQLFHRAAGEVDRATGNSPDAFRGQIQFEYRGGEDDRRNERLFFRLPAGNKEGFLEWREKLQRALDAQIEAMKEGWTVLVNERNKQWFTHALTEPPEGENVSRSTAIQPLVIILGGKVRDVKRLGVRYITSGNEVTTIKLHRRMMQNFLNQVGLKVDEDIKAKPAEPEQFVRQS